MVNQTQFTPLSEALCKCIDELNASKIDATFKAVTHRLQSQFPNMELPSIEILQRSFSMLIKEEKIYYFPEKNSFISCANSGSYNSYSYDIANNLADDLQTLSLDNNSAKCNCITTTMTMTKTTQHNEELFASMNGKSNFNGRESCSSCSKSLSTALPVHGSDNNHHTNNTRSNSSSATYESSDNNSNSNHGNNSKTNTNTSKFKSSTPLKRSASLRIERNKCVVNGSPDEMLSGNKTLGSNFHRSKSFRLNRSKHHDLHSNDSDIQKSNTIGHKVETYKKQSMLSKWLRFGSNGSNNSGKGKQANHSSMKSANFCCQFPEDKHHLMQLQLTSRDLETKSTQTIKSGIESPSQIAALIIKQASKHALAKCNNNSDYCYSINSCRDPCCRKDGRVRNSYCCESNGDINGHNHWDRDSNSGNQWMFYKSVSQSSQQTSKSINTNSNKYSRRCSLAQFEQEECFGCCCCYTCSCSNTNTNYNNYNRNECCWNKTTTSAHHKMNNGITKDAKQLAYNSLNSNSKHERDHDEISSTNCNAPIIPHALGLMGHCHTDNNRRLNSHNYMPSTKKALPSPSNTNANNRPFSPGQDKKLALLPPTYCEQQVPGMDNNKCWTINQNGKVSSYGTTNPIVVNNNGIMNGNACRLMSSIECSNTASNVASNAASSEHDQYIKGKKKFAFANSYNAKDADNDNNDDIMQTHSLPLQLHQHSNSLKLGSKQDTQDNSRSNKILLDNSVNVKIEIGSTSSINVTNDESHGSEDAMSAGNTHITASANTNTHQLEYNFNKLSPSSQATTSAIRSQMLSNGNHANQTQTTVAATISTSTTTTHADISQNYKIDSAPILTSATTITTNVTIPNGYNNDSTSAFNKNNINYNNRISSPINSSKHELDVVRKIQSEEFGRGNNKSAEFYGHELRINSIPHLSPIRQKVAKAKAEFFNSACPQSSTLLTKNSNLLESRAN